MAKASPHLTFLQLGSGRGLPLRLARWLPALAGVLLFTLAAYLMQPEVDFHYIYRPIVRAWLLEGHPLYGEGARGFYNPPWTAFFLLPFVLFPERWGKTILALFSMGIILWTTHYFYGEGKGRPLALGLVLASLHTMTVTLGGQIDAFPLLGVLLGWRASEIMRHGARPDRRGLLLLSLSLLLLSIKPQVALLVVVMYLLPLKNLSWRARWVVLSLPLSAFLISLPLFGMDWPWQWWTAYRAQPPYHEFTVTTWMAANKLGIPLWIPILAVAGVLVGTGAAYLRLGPSKDMVGLALLGGALSTFYASPSGTLFVLAVSFPRLLALKPALALPIYLLSLTPFLRLIYTIGISWTDVAFWWALWLALYPILLSQDPLKTRPGES